MFEDKFRSVASIIKYVNTIEETHRTLNIFSVNFVFSEISLHGGFGKFSLKDLLPEFCCWIKDELLYTLN